MSRLSSASTRGSGGQHHQLPLHFEWSPHELLLPPLRPNLQQAALVMFISLQHGLPQLYCSCLLEEDQRVHVFLDVLSRTKAVLFSFVCHMHFHGCKYEVLVSDDLSSTIS